MARRPTLDCCHVFWKYWFSARKRKKKCHPRGIVKPQVLQQIVESLTKSRAGSVRGLPITRTCMEGGFELEYMMIRKETDPTRLIVTVGYTVLPNPVEWDMFEMDAQTFMASMDNVQNAIGEWLGTLTCMYSVCPDCLRLGVWDHSSCPSCRKKTHHECCICWERTFGHPLGCNHVIHMLCLLRMIDTGNTYSCQCPLCRQQLSLEKDLNILLTQNREEK